MDTKQIIVYDEKNDSCRFAQIADDTFTIAQKEDGSFESMTYGEWEALRCRQACAAAKAQVAKLDADAAKKAELEGFLDSFTEAMQVKYLEGKRSWGQIYDELVADFKQLLA